MYRDNDRSKLFSRRVALIGGAKLGLFGLLFGRMYQLQVLESRKYQMLAEDNRISVRLIPPLRGRIFDRNGEILALNRENYRVLVIAEQSRNVEGTLDSLAELLPISDVDRRRILRDVRRNRSFVPVLVRENLSWEDVAKIEVNAPDLPGVIIDVGQSREYMHTNASAHVLGYVAAVSEAEQQAADDPLLELPGFRIGKNGIEKIYDEDLRGRAGTSQLEVNALGRVIRELNRQEGQPGSDIVTTIDLRLQQLAFDRLYPHGAASAVVLDITNGDVLVLASVPVFDPNAFNTGLSGDAWRTLIRDPLGPLNNKAISGQYSPGSTFKMVVSLAAMEHNVAEPEHRVFCRGYTQLGDARFHCWKKHGHGSVNMVEGLEQSCDVYFYEMAKRLGVDRIAQMANKLGLGDVVGIDIPGEKKGLIPTRKWKRAATGVPWQHGETLVAGIGQGFVLTTPLQLAVMTARIASNGRAVKPRLVLSIADEKETPETPYADLGIPESALRVTIEGMRRVSNSPRGTAYRARIAEKGMELAGKTGTSQVRRIALSERDASGAVRKREVPWVDRDHALFVGYAPVHAPKYAVAVVVEHGGGGSTVAAPIARDLLLEAQKRGQGAPVAGQSGRSA